MLSTIWSGSSSPGNPFVETSVKLLKRRCGLKTRLSINEIPTSDAPTTTIRKFIETFEKEKN
jgi:hypothetical protein